VVISNQHGGFPSAKVIGLFAYRTDPKVKWEKSYFLKFNLSLQFAEMKFGII
jgi:hypothetical protein